MSNRWALVGGVAAAIIALDQLTKHWALERLSDGRTIDLVGSLRFNLAFNTGMAFSAGSGSGAIIGAVALLIVVVLVVVARRIDSKLQLVLVGIVIGGAVGNVIDRLFRSTLPGMSDGFMSGAVVDFVDLQWWPVFNVADAAIVVGGISLALLERAGAGGGRAAGVRWALRARPAVGGRGAVRSRRGRARSGSRGGVRGWSPGRRRGVVTGPGEPDGPGRPDAEVIPVAFEGERVDRVVAMVTGCSRAEASAAIAAGTVLLDDQVVAQGLRAGRRGPAAPPAGRPRACRGTGRCGP